MIRDEAGGPEIFLGPQNRADPFGVRTAGKRIGSARRDLYL